MNRVGTRLVSLLALLLAVPAAGLELEVRYRSADAVYLSGGTAEGVQVGDRFRVLHGDSEAALLEVVFTAEHSSSCRVLQESGAVAAGDRAVSIATTPTGDAPTAPAEEPAQTPEPGSAAPATTPVAAVPTPAYERSDSQWSRRRPSWSGSVSFDFDDYSDERDDGDGLDYQRSTARLSLRGRDLGGLPLELRVRARGQQIERSRAVGTGAEESESRHRLYELSLTWDPPQGRFRFSAGRLGTSPFVGIGYLDGAIGEVRVGSHVHVGAFAGSRPDLSDGDGGFGSLGSSYGALVRFHSRTEGAIRPPFEVLFAGVRDEGDLDVSREYAVVEARYIGGGIWTFHQRAEVDVNNGWRQELAGSTTQLSNLSLSATARINEKRRFTLSYNRFERYWTEETRFIDQELFDSLWRQGLRASVDLGRPGGLTFTLQGGLRSREDGDEDSVSFGLGVRHPGLFDRRLSASLYAMSYTTELADGLLLTSQLGHRFRGGHSLNLSLGGRLTRNNFIDEETQLYWVRVGFWAELPGSLFARGDVELTEGDGYGGILSSVGLGVRF
ncbi:MAG: hypothetical protein R2991_09745 [Thermoanaerobaculia bacterium]